MLKCELMLGKPLIPALMFLIISTDLVEKKNNNDDSLA